MSNNSIQNTESVSTYIKFFHRDIQASASVEFPTSDFIDAVLAPNLLTKYCVDPTTLLINTRKFIRNHWREQYGQFYSFSWDSDWHTDYRRLLDNYVTNRQFSIIDIGPVENPQDVPKTGLEMSVLKRWCSQDIGANIFNQSYNWAWPADYVWRVGEVPVIKSADLYIAQWLNMTVVATKNITDFGQAVAQLVIPLLFSIFYALEAKTKGPWPKKLLVKKCELENCQKVYIKYRKPGQPSRFCSKTCGSVVRNRRFREIKSERRLANG